MTVTKRNTFTKTACDANGTLRVLWGALKTSKNSRENRDRAKSIPLFRETLLKILVLIFYEVCHTGFVFFSDKIFQLDIIHLFNLNDLPFTNLLNQDADSGYLAHQASFYRSIPSTNL